MTSQPENEILDGVANRRSTEKKLASAEKRRATLRTTEEKRTMDQDDGHHKPGSTEDTQDRIARIKQILVSGSRYHDDAEAPPVDIPLLKRYLVRQVTPEEDQKVDDLLRRYRPWIEAIDTLDGNSDNPIPFDHSPNRS